ncbi:MAG: divergent PAP2 family protein [Candidatus Kerfeldbacteria bacterium]|nr:divergent PAP2 family protein [Candidatus Kerfeldbacteria bacterium]
MAIWIELIGAPILTMIVVQSIKLATDGIKGNFTIKGFMTTYGGMPSGHSAYVTALTTSVGFNYGVETPVFAVAVIFSLLVITDAMYLRRRIDLVAKAANHIVATLPADQRSGFTKLETKIEHTFPQVAVGALCGFIIAYLLHLWN